MKFIILWFVQIHIEKSLKVLYTLKIGVYLLYQMPHLSLDFAVFSHFIWLVPYLVQIPNARTLALTKLYSFFRFIIQLVKYSMRVSIDSNQWLDLLVASLGHLWHLWDLRNLSHFDLSFFKWQEFIIVADTDLSDIVFTLGFFLYLLDFFYLNLRRGSDWNIVFREA